VTWSQAILALAILVLFIAWRRARGQTAALHARIEEHRARNTFTFEAIVDESGRSIAVLDAADARIDPASLGWEEHGLEQIAGAYDGGGSPAPGTAVELVEADDGVEVWTRDVPRRLGRLHGEHERAVRDRLARREVGGCVLLNEPRGEQGVFDLLLIHAGVDVEF
jgi:hypothetical protein